MTFEVESQNQQPPLRKSSLRSGRSTQGVFEETLSGTVLLNITWSSGSPLPSTGWVLVAGHIQDVLGTSPFSATNRAGGRAWGILQRCASTGTPQSPSPYSGVSHPPLPKGLPLFCFGTTEKNPVPACSPQPPEPIAPFNWPGSAPEYRLCPGSISAWGNYPLFPGTPSERGLI